MLHTVSSFVLEYTFTGKIRGLGGSEGGKMVELGLSRFKGLIHQDKTVAETDEPLAILSLVHFLSEKNLTLENHLRGDLDTAVASARGFAFEPFCAYLLARAFSSPTPLSNVFDFVGEYKHGNELAELVTLEKGTNGDFTHITFDINSDLRSSHVVGYSPSSPADTLKWLQNPQGSAFCFPSNDVGPGLIFVLRLSKDNTFLRVCIQIKNQEKLDHSRTEGAIRTTDPFQFCSRRADDGQAIPDPSIQKEMVKAIQNLGAGTKKAGVCGVLRVLISYPSPPNDDALAEATESGHGHPLATAPVAFLELENSNLGQSIPSLAKKAKKIVTLPDRKRKNTDQPTGSEGRSAKKRKK